MRSIPPRARAAAPLILALAGFLTLACGREEAKAPAAPDPAAAAETSRPAAETPADFPDDVPLYVDAKPMASVATADDGTIVSLRTHDAPERVRTWYRDHFAEQGWEVEHDQEMRGHSILAVRKGNRVASVVITGAPRFTEVMLTVAEDR